MVKNELYKLIDTRREMELTLVEGRWCRELGNRNKITYCLMFTTEINDEVVDVEYDCKNNGVKMDDYFTGKEGQTFKVKANIINCWAKLNYLDKDLLVINRLYICK